MSSSFQHLSVRSHYSLCESALRAGDIVTFAKNNQLKAIGITDTANLFGALENAIHLAEHGIQPLIGIRMPVAFSKDDTYFSYISLYPPSEKAYKHLLKLASKIHSHPLSHGHALLFDDLVHNTEDLIAHTGSSDGIIPQIINHKKINHAELILSQLKDAFQDRLYLAISRHGYLREKHAEPVLLNLAHSHKLPLLAVQDALILSPQDYKTLRILYSIQQKNTHIDSINPDTLSDQLSLKKPAIMERLFHDIPEAIDNTQHFPERFAFMPTPHKPMMPRFNDNMSKEQEDQLLKEQAYQGLEKRKLIISSRNPNATFSQYTERLDYELGIITRMGYSGYFLIVSDFVNWAKKQKIPVGPGRGSGAGSLVAYCTDITAFDPLQWDLMFERFLNPERINLPDFDIDFSQEGRNDVIRYVFDTYGENRVSQIITFGSLRARAAIQDVGRATGKPYGEIERLAKLIPTKNEDGKLLTTIDEAIKTSSELQSTIQKEPSIKEWIALAKSIEGLARHASTHAGGVIISPVPIHDVVPLYHDDRTSIHITQFDMHMAERAGLVKFDFLGLNTLSIINNACELVNARHNLNLSPDNLPLDDKKTFEHISTAETFGLFQIESGGMRNAIRQLQPQSLQELIALIALYRPGPMDKIPNFIARKHRREPVSYPLPQLEPILKETYGIIVYQEQVIEIAKLLAGFSLAEADLLRRAMGKKDSHAMEKVRDDFIQKSQLHSKVSHNDALTIFEAINKFSEYGFNKCHSSGYALICFQAAFFKANYPLEFFTASLNGDIQNKDRLAEYISKLDTYNITLLPPDINTSASLFSIENNNSIRLGLSSLKNISPKDMEDIISLRNTSPFSSLEDFCHRVQPHLINKRALENLIRAGTFDSLNYNRVYLLKRIEPILLFCQEQHLEKTSQQSNLFSSSETKLPPLFNTSNKDTTPLPSPDIISSMEFEAFGFYFSSHPLDAFQDILNAFGFSSFHTIDTSNTHDLLLAGQLEKFKIRKNKQKLEYAVITLSDKNGKYEVFVPHRVYSSLSLSLRDAQKSLLYLEASAKYDDDKLLLFAHNLSSLHEHFNQNTNPLHITLKNLSPLQRSESLQSLKNFFLVTPHHSHSVPIHLTLQNHNQPPLSFNTHEKLSLSIEALHTILSIEGVQSLRFTSTQ